MGLFDLDDFVLCETVGSMDQLGEHGFGPRAKYEGQNFCQFLRSDTVTFSERVVDGTHCYFPSPHERLDILCLCMIDLQLLLMIHGNDLNTSELPKRHLYKMPFGQPGIEPGSPQYLRRSGPY